jgi:hypothetical protein
MPGLLANLQNSTGFRRRFKFRMLWISQKGAEEIKRI